MRVRADMLNGHLTCHGGFIFSLADSAFAFACNSYNLTTVASGCTIEFVAPARENDVLTAVARERSASGRTGVYDIEVTNQHGAAIAFFRGKSYRIKGHVLDGADRRGIASAGGWIDGRQEASARRSRADRDRQPRRAAGPAACSACSGRLRTPTTTSRTTARRSTRAGVHPRDCRSLADLARFPFTVKTDLRDNYPFGMFAVPREQVVRIHASSGTTGKPTVVGYTRADIDTWADVMARSIRAAGGRAGDIVHVAYGYGLFTGGLGAHYGAERLGATVIPMSGGQTEKQVQLIQDFKPNIIMVTPSYMLAIAEEMERQGIDPRQTLARDRHFRRRAVDARRCGRRSRRGSTWTRSTSTACPR